MSARPKSRATPLDRTLTHRLHTLQKLSDRVSQAAYLRETSIPLSEGRCLAAIGAFEPLSVKHLAQQANLDKGQASRAAQALVDQDLVRKDVNGDDARGVVLSLTPAGRQRWEAVMRLIEQRNREIFGCLDAAEQALFGKMLDRLVERARQAASS